MLDDRQYRVMIMAGGTGGHVFPALAVVDELRKENVALAWLGTRRGIEAELVPKNQIDLHYLDIEGIRGRGLGALLKAPLLLLRSIVQSLHVLSQFKPEVVLGMGGFASGPGAIAAWLKRIPIVIHEQNSIAGTTNRISAIFATKVMQGFPNTLKRGEWCGNPVRFDIANLPPPQVRFAGRTGKTRVLIVGGSRGALAINTLLPKALKQIDEEIRPEILHQTGKVHWQGTLDLYYAQDLNPQSEQIKVVDFIESMAAAYEWADFVICRAGALTIAELTSAGLGSLLIPFPFAIDDHQTANGQLLVSQGAAVMVQQAQLSAEQLAEQLVVICGDAEKRLNMAMRARELAKNSAAREVARICMEVSRG
jgi:UDP-N-acetylglucosamine--N-acetylmuramyl-(pentapeptide) pyrophosphoryl-undecaprenol N-acetylglucosamine transferase